MARGWPAYGSPSCPWPPGCGSAVFGRHLLVLAWAHVRPLGDREGASDCMVSKKWNELVRQNGNNREGVRG
eukprot:6896586-Prymnesium_polylepis.1